MKAFNLKNMFKGGMLTMLVLFAVGAFAASKGGLQLQHPTNVGGKQLATGTYSVQWDGTGDQVDLKVFQGKKEVASTSAQVVKMDHPQEPRKTRLCQARKESMSYRSSTVRAYRHSRSISIGCSTTSIPRCGSSSPVRK